MTDPVVKRCHGCQGTTAAAALGWYSLSVTVPREMGKNGQPFLWVGLWCSVACLETSLPDLRRQEELAHEAYQPVRPRSGGRQ